MWWPWIGAAGRRRQRRHIHNLTGVAHLRLFVAIRGLWTDVWHPGFRVLLTVDIWHMCNNIHTAAAPAPQSLIINFTRFLVPASHFTSTSRRAAITARCNITRSKTNEEQQWHVCGFRNAELQHFLSLLKTLKMVVPRISRTAWWKWGLVRSRYTGEAFKHWSNWKSSI